MTEESSWKLHLWKPHMGSRRGNSWKRKKKHRNGGVNRLIATEVRMSAALRYFASGSPEDIAICHDIGHSEVFNSGCWRVVDAVNKCPELTFDFPTCHQKQMEMALAF
jgi:hypothetical protein